MSTEQPYEYNDRDEEYQPYEYNDRDEEYQ